MTNNKEKPPALPMELEAMNPSEYLDHEVEQFRQYLCDSGHLEDDPISDYWQSLYFAIKFFKERVKLDAQSPARVNRELLGALKDIKAEFERLKEAVMIDENLSFIQRIKDATYLDGVLAVITSKSDAVVASAEQLERSKPC